jgi:hypothetical protein
MKSNPVNDGRCTHGTTLGSYCHECTTPEPTTAEIRERHESVDQYSDQGKSLLLTPFAKVIHTDRGILLDRLEDAEKELSHANRPQYCVCNKHPWFTSISNSPMVCQACRAEDAEAQLEFKTTRVGELARKWREAEETIERVKALPVQSGVEIALYDMVSKYVKHDAIKEALGDNEIKPPITEV